MIRGMLLWIIPIGAGMSGLAAFLQGAWVMTMFIFVSAYCYWLLVTQGMLAEYF